MLHALVRGGKCAKLAYQRYTRDWTRIKRARFIRVPITCAARIQRRWVRVIGKWGSVVIKRLRVTSCASRLVRVWLRVHRDLSTCLALLIRVPSAFESRWLADALALHRHLGISCANDDYHHWSPGQQFPIKSFFKKSLIFIKKMLLKNLVCFCKWHLAGKWSLTHWVLVGYQLQSNDCNLSRGLPGCISNFIHIEKYVARLEIHEWIFVITAYA